MRKKKKEIGDLEDMESIVKEARVCRIALSQDDMPYIVPMIFGYRNSTVYLHTAPEGKKIDMMKANDKVCFEVDVGSKIVEADKACDWGVEYRSVIGFGKAHFIEDIEEKKEALDVIMGHYSPGKTYEYPVEMLDKVAVIRIDLDSMTGKHH